ncbi:something about silencing protein 10-like [Pyrus ussuriensis x Pyrus communis]|uniref:Something about silencing protein 10-like n=1 Tax=Pyrus ussuriensis x Pyrus communis TaxID=2448454 RepID=A0A5N5G7B3_9ROSA|nr:something about silencing protein 10-like [Pyrus ussuriensis x Pyrus communis]
MDDEIDAFHKQRDIIPLDVNEEDGDSDEDNEQPVFGLEDIHDDDDDDVDDDRILAFLQKQKFLREKFGAEDDLHDDEENEEEEKPVWGGKRQNYYGVDNGDFEVRA